MTPWPALPQHATAPPVPALPRFTISTATFDAIARGGAGEEGIRLLLSARRSIRLLHLCALAGRAPEREEGLGPAFAALGRLHGRAPQHVIGLLDSPAVGAFLAESLVGRRGGAPEAAYLWGIVAAAAAVAKADGDVLVPAAGDVAVMLPAMGAASPRAGASAIRIRVREGRVVIASGGRAITVPEPPSASAPGWQGLRSLTVRHAGMPLCLLLDDVDPYRWPVPDAHTPDAHTPDAPAPRLRPDQVSRWRDLLDEAWGVLARHHLGSARELTALISTLVPMTPGGADRHISATSARRLGSIALSEPGDALTLAATLVHELQHAKLCTLHDLVPLHRDAGEPRFYAPWRDDPRPLGGLLHGTYAHLGITRFWAVERRRLRGPQATRAQVEFARWREQTCLSLARLREDPALTPAGRRFVDRMAAALAPALAQRVPREAVTVAREAAERHTAAWRDRHGTPEP